MEREPELRALDHHVVLELARAVAGLVIGAQPAITELCRTPLGEAPVQIRISLPGEVRPNAETAHVKVPVEGELFADEREAQVRAEDGIPPILRAGGDLAQ